MTKKTDDKAMTKKTDDKAMTKKTDDKATEAPEMTNQQKRMALVAAGFDEMKIKALMRVFG